MQWIYGTIPESIQREPGKARADLCTRVHIEDRFGGVDGIDALAPSPDSEREWLLVGEGLEESEHIVGKQPVNERFAALGVFAQAGTSFGGLEPGAAHRHCLRT